jgi:hypothetical protein
MRGGRKGGLPICERNKWLSNGGATLATIDGNTTGETDAPAMLKHFSAQTAMEPQSVIPLSQGLAWRGQQTMSSIADISVLSADLEAIFVPATAGSVATDSAIRIANMVRANAMSQGMEYQAAANHRSSDDFASGGQ